METLMVLTVAIMCFSIGKKCSIFCLYLYSRYFKDEMVIWLNKIFYSILQKWLSWRKKIDE